MPDENDPSKRVNVRLNMPEFDGALGAVHHALAGLGWKHDKIAGTDGFVVDLGNDAFEGGIAQVLTDDNRFIFLIDFKQKFKRDQAQAASEFAARANSGMIIGNFELDFSDGTIRFKSSVDFSGTECLPQLVHNAVTAAQRNAETYAAHIPGILTGKKSPKQGVLDAES